MITCARCGHRVGVIGPCRTCAKARRILDHAIEHLRPMAIADTQKEITPNAEALAISSLALAMVAVVK
jgi:hypothetical protein